jgi:hypothetical protein
MECSARCAAGSDFLPHASYYYLENTMRVIACKVQRAAFDKTMPDGSVRTFFSKIGAYMELNDGHRIKCPDGTVRVGTGTVVRYNYKHQTWSVQPPARALQNRMGYTFVHGSPEWELPLRYCGMSETEFARQYSAQLRKLCITHMTLEY